jgi:hypothetical protein
MSWSALGFGAEIGHRTALASPPNHVGAIPLSCDKLPDEGGSGSGDPREGT